MITILFLVTINNFDNSSEFLAKAGINFLSIKSISKRLNESGLQSRIAAIKDILTPEHRTLELEDYILLGATLTIPLNFGGGCFLPMKNHGHRQHTARSAFGDIRMRDSRKRISIL